MSIINENKRLKPNIHLFMLRLWQEELGNEETDWRGKVQHVNSGEAIYFRDWQMMEAFIERLARLNTAEESGDTVGKE